MSNFLPRIPKSALEQAASIESYYDLLTQPLHEELYKRQSFDFLDELSEGQQLLISYDYVRQQVLQGGFIQLIQNGYIGLLPDMPRSLQIVGATGMANVIDEALRVYVLNREILERETTVEEFALLYKEIRDFETLDEKFAQLDGATIKHLLEYATHHMSEFAELY